VALKMIRRDILGGPRAFERFRDEMRILARLSLPHVVTIYDSGEHDGFPYYTMEYLKDGSVAGRMDGQPWPPAVAAALIEDVARDLDKIHVLSIIHRDLKPGNILLAGEVPKIADFGVAARLDELPDAAAIGDSRTPAYMAPEQLVPGIVARIDHRCDVWALGVILLELLTGRHPFLRLGDGLGGIVCRVLKDEPGPFRKVPRDLRAIASKCLRKIREHRYGSTGELAEDLRRFRMGEPIRARFVGPHEWAWKLCRRKPAAAVAAISPSSSSPRWPTPTGSSPAATGPPTCWPRGPSSTGSIRRSSRVTSQ
jgi:serine/threonine-protein kinase